MPSSAALFRRALTMAVVAVLGLGLTVQDAGATPSSATATRHSAAQTAMAGVPARTTLASRRAQVRRDLATPHGVRFSTGSLRRRPSAAQDRADAQRARARQQAILKAMRIRAAQRPGSGVPNASARPTAGAAPAGRSAAASPAASGEEYLGDPLAVAVVGPSGPVDWSDSGPGSLSTAGMPVVSGINGEGLVYPGETLTAYASVYAWDDCLQTTCPPSDQPVQMSWTVMCNGGSVTYSDTQTVTAPTVLSS
jgi:hypothetical protein